MFSFNNPVGACPTCDGLGTQEFFDPAKIVAHPHLSLAGGAVRGWDRRNAYYFQMMQSLARHMKFDIEAPFESSRSESSSLVLYGSGEEQIEFKYLDGRGGTDQARMPFEGIVRNLERRYRETESPTVREELAKYRWSAPAPPAADPAERAARNVFVDGRSLPEVVGAVGRSTRSSISPQLKLPGWRGEVAARSSRKSASGSAFSPMSASGT